MSLCLVGHSGKFPPVGPIPFSISRLARSFGVSRARLRTLLRDAGAVGLLERSEPDTLQMLPRLEGALRRLFALHLILNAHCVRLAIAESEPRSHVA